MRPSQSDPVLTELEERVADALELPEDEQRVEFDRIRAEHPQHDALLRRWEKAALEVVPAPDSSGADVSAPLPRSPRPLPERIGDYKILDRLGEGGMGVVYLAEQTEPVRRRVALKVVLEGQETGQVVARFESERQALALMSHNHIAKVLDAGVTDDGRPYFALEHVPGRAITAYCDVHKLSVRERIELLQKVCGAVQHAHQKGIVHRDLKPSNVLVRACDGYAEPKVIDFGVAKALQQRLTERTLYTEQGRILGTPEYMSPEQADMGTVDVDTRSDIYSLGVMLYELLVGKLPFDSEDLRSSGYFAMQRKILEDDPVRPSTRSSTLDGETARGIAKRRRTDPSSLERTLQGDLDWIIMRCLEKDPSRRYQSASELSADLQRYLDGDPVLAGPPSALYRLEKLARKHVGALVAAAAVLIALVVGLGFATWQWGEARKSEQSAKQSLDAALESEARAQDAEEATARELDRSRAMNLALASERTLSSSPLEALQLALAAMELDDNPLTRARVLSALTRQHLVTEFTGHAESFDVADLHPESRRIVTGSADGTARVWSWSGEELLSLPHDGVVCDAHFTPDGSHILTVCAPKRGREVARAFDDSGRLVAEVGAEAGSYVHSVDWNEDGTQLAVANYDGSVELFDRTGSRLLELHAKLPPNWNDWKTPAMVHFAGGALLVSQQGPFLDPAENDGLKRGPGAIFLHFDPGSAPPVQLEPHEARYWPLKTSNVRGVNVWPPHVRIVTRSASLDPRGELFAALARSEHQNEVHLWSKSGDLVAVLQDGPFEPLAVAFSPTGDKLLTTSKDGLVRLWSRDGRRIAACEAGSADLVRARFFGSGDRIVATTGTRAKLFNRDGRVLLEVPIGGPLFLLDADAASGVVLTKRLGGEVALWQLAGIEPYHLVGEQDRLWGFHEGPDGQILTSGEDGRVLSLGARGVLSHAYESGSERPIFGIDTSPDGRLLVAGGSMGAIFGWDLQTRELLWTHHCPGDAEVTFVAFAKDDTLIAVQGPANRAYRVDCSTGEFHDLIDHNDPVDPHAVRPNNVCVSRDGELIALGTREGYVRLHAADGSTLVTLPVGSAGLGFLGVRFHPDGRHMTTASDGTVKVWDLERVLGSETPVAPVRSFPGFGCAFSPDGRRALVRSTGSARIVTWGNEEEVHQVILADTDTNRPVGPAVYSRDGQWLMARTFAGVRRWPADPAGTLALARRHVARFGTDLDLAKYDHLVGPRED